MKKSKGFTLIELLVVIAIIGILAAIVLVSLSGAKNRAKDARITADMQQMRNLAEIYNSETGNYNNLNTETDYLTLFNDMAQQGPESPYLATADGKYCMAVKLNNGSYWCIDSNLRSKSYDTDPTTCVVTDPKCEQ